MEALDTLALKIYEGTKRALDRENWDEVLYWGRRDVNGLNHGI